ncbi:methyltransferase domain-containing protein [Actinomycetes bacterium KLBMP 9797]
MPTRLVARAVRGVEELVAEEIHGRGIGVVDRIGHREVHFTTADPATALTALSTADDVLLFATSVAGIGDTKADLARLRGGLTSMDAPGLMAQRRRLGGVAPHGGIDVSASFVGRRRFGRFDIEDAVGGYLAAALRLPYHSRRAGARPPAGTCAWRVTLDGPLATVALRVADRPSHRRGYKRATVPGTLHPPLAAAMVRLAEPRAGHTVVDPCCGAGTLLIEAGIAVPGLRLLGADRDEAALRAARDNADGVSVTWLPADAARLPLATASADRLLVNPPWGRQVPPRGALAARPEGLWAQARRVLRPDGRLVALLHDADGVQAVARHGFTVTHTGTIRLAGTLTTLLVASS